MERKNAGMKKQKDELVELLKQSSKILTEVSEQDKAMLTALRDLLEEKEARDKQRQRVDLQASTKDGNMHTDVPLTPEKKRTLKKSSSELVIKRTPPKPPEGTPQRQKKTKMSNSPLSASNQFESPLPMKRKVI
jgi:hypothetical protein